MSIENAMTIIDFWKGAGASAWFRKNGVFDQDIRQRFGQLVEDAGDGRLEDWLDEPQTCLAYILLLDQFTRNIFRQNARAFEHDDKALNAAKIAIENNYIASVDIELQSFFIMPFMHSEHLDDQLRCIELMKIYSSEDSVKFAVIHYDLIEKFGRFPHRNEVLGRKSSALELEFLAGDGFKG